MASVLDSRIFRNLFGTEEVRQVFSDEAYVKLMVDVEAALAIAESKAGVIPENAGEQLARELSHVQVDMDKLSRDTEIVGYPVFPLTEQLVAKTSPDVAKYIHWGATTQDIMDNASILQIRHGLGIVRRQLHKLIAVLQGLSLRYRDTPMAGRTHLQHALPCTFGYKCAVYLSSLLRHAERLEELQKRCLVVQFGGAAGTLASIGSAASGTEVRAQLARELQLADPIITWHAARDGIAEVLNFLGLVGGSLGKIAYDLIFMSSNEVGEVSEPFVPHRGASSTMPQKRNPISSEVILAASKLLRANASLGLDAMVVDFERASGPWHLEWAALPEAFILASGSLSQACFALDGLVVNVEAMKRNLDSTEGLIVGEAVMMALAPALGRQQAHDMVYEACKESIESKVSLLDSLMKCAVVTQTLDEQKLAELCDPVNYLGASQQMVDDVVTASKTYMGRTGVAPGSWESGKPATNGVVNGKGESKLTNGI